MIFFLVMIVSCSFACNDNNVKTDTEVIKHTFTLESATFPSLCLCFVEKEDEPNKAYFRSAHTNDPKSFCYISPRHVDSDSSTFLKDKSLFFYLSRTGDLLVLNLQSNVPKICKIATVYSEGYARELFFCANMLFLAVHTMRERENHKSAHYRTFLHKVWLGGSGCSTTYIKMVEGAELFKKNIENYIPSEALKSEDNDSYDLLASQKEYVWNEPFLEYKRKQH